MMRSLYLNEKGLTLTELIISLGISSLLLIFIISGSIFTKKYLSTWKNENRLYEELRFIGNEFYDNISRSKKILLFEDSTKIYYANKQNYTYVWTSKSFYRNQHKLTSNYISSIDLDISKIPLLNNYDSTILDSSRSGLYKVEITLQDVTGIKDSITLNIINNNEYYKNK